MSFAAWLLAATLGCSIAAPLAAQEPALSVNGQQIAQEGDEVGEAGGKQNTPTPLPQPPDFTPAIQGIETAIRDLVSQQNRPESDEERDRAKRDLEAQEDMAWWAAAMFSVTVASVLVTAMGVYLVWRTLLATRRAADAAVTMVGEAQAATRAGQAAVEQAEISNHLLRESFAAEIRPWITVAIALEGDLHVGSGKISAFLKITATNIGKSPAHNVRLAFMPTMDVSNKGIRQAIDYIIKNNVTHTSGVGVTLLPGDVHIDDKIQSCAFAPHLSGAVYFAVGAFYETASIKGVRETVALFYTLFKLNTDRSVIVGKAPYQIVRANGGHAT